MIMEFPGSVEREINGFTMTIYTGFQQKKLAALSCLLLLSHLYLLSFRR